jgi:hypothetical protein
MNIFAYVYLWMPGPNITKWILDKSQSLPFVTTPLISLLPGFCLASKADVKITLRSFSTTVINAGDAGEGTTEPESCARPC